MSDECELMRKIVRDAFWKVAYHEWELSRAHKFLAVAHALVGRTEMQVTEKEAHEAYNDHEEEEDCETPTTLLAYTLGCAMHRIDYHEAELREGHNNLAQAKALALRAGIEMPLAEIEAEQRKRVAG